MEITSAIGSGRNELDAFDDALVLAGAGNLNLVRLSSVIPSGVQVIVRPLERAGESLVDRLASHGDRLWCVYARADIEPGRLGAAGVGWVNGKDGGLFVEHHAVVMSLEGRHPGDMVERDIAESLAGLCRRRRFVPEEQNALVTCAIQPQKVHQCALVLAAYTVQGW